MIGFYNYTVILTYCSLISALIGTHFAFQHQYVIALVCLMLCGFFDSFDGMVARSKKDRTDEEKMFGIQIDSLVDLVSFGVFPAIIAYSMGFTKARCLPFFAIYVLSAVIRLGYFNVKEDLRQKKTSEKRKYYTGLPVTSSSIIFPAIYCLSAWFKIPTVQMIYFVGLGVVGLLFISPIKVPKPDLREIIILIILGVVVFIILAYTGTIRMGGHPFSWLSF